MTPDMNPNWKELAPETVGFFVSMVDSVDEAIAKAVCAFRADGIEISEQLQQAMAWQALKIAHAQWRAHHERTDGRELH